MDFVKGSLKSNFKFWKESLKAREYICNVVQYGYLIPFTTEPGPAHLNNNKSACERGVFVRAAIADLLASGVVVECVLPTLVVNPLSVSVNSKGKERLILDLRYVNQFVDKQKFKLEGVKEVLDYVKKGSFAFKFDLKSHRNSHRTRNIFGVFVLNILLLHVCLSVCHQPLIFSPRFCGLWLKNGVLRDL